MSLKTEEKIEQPSAVIFGIEAGTQSISRTQIRNVIVRGRLLGVKSAICYIAAQCSSTDRETAKFKSLQIQVAHYKY